ncbi:MAG: SDR family oxidoreductase [Actinomycetota bacterium]
MGSVVLLTGATGFVGTEVGCRLLDRDDLSLVALIQAATDEEARRSARRTWYGRTQLTEAVGGRVEVVAGDVTQPLLGLDPEAYAALARRLTHVVHTAANVRFDASLDDLRRTNVVGTANILALARAAHADHGLERLLHVSTAYVAGRRKGEVGEDDLTDRFGFENDYERTKYEAERLVREAMAALPVTVGRPGMIVGDSRTGEIATFNTFYVLLRRYLTRRTHVVPGDPRMRVNIVPVDVVADAIVRLLFDPRAEGRTVHLTAPRASLPTAAEVVRAVRGWARAELGIRLPRPILVPLPRVPLPGRAGDRLDVLLPYLRERRTFRRDHADRLLGPYELGWEAYLPTLIRSAVDRGFLHRSGRTVHEQAMFRLRSRKLPVRYVDIVDGQAYPRSGADVRADVLASASTLRGMGIGAGTRVAIVGPNGTRYLTLDLALGLLGAVSVPLYATTPPDEVDAILRSSRAEGLLVGSPRILEDRGPVASSLPTASFCRGAPPAGVLGWDDLVAHREDAPEIERAPVGLEDVATLRYTSGTTGFPKGVAFTHGQLRWMAETIASLVPWRARTRPVAYVSFLPMNHVVEGIMGTYGPYAMPAPVEIAFVEDIHDVADALRSIRPTVFFSVPRLYEKVWERVEGSEAGRRFLAMQDGPAKRALGSIVRRSVLRRAGLDRCAQLIVGSAPVPLGLLGGFHELGVEVHDAYGLTEAPLLTLNRSGRNRIGTVGEPLPGTAVRIADDEILARGPQVTIGYDDRDAVQPFRDGWLATGDLGHMDGGCLVIDGRKKELLKTSYGKYLNPAKIEARLLRIPGVTNAMVVGEARPFCAALLWIDGSPTEARRDLVAGAIAEIGRSLSHPEQVKRWVVLADDLSVEAGDLTPNLKLRREHVAARFADVIDGLYEREEVRA